MAIAVNDLHRRSELVGKLLDEATAAWLASGEATEYDQILERLMDDVTEATRAALRNESPDAESVEWRA